MRILPERSTSCPETLPHKQHNEEQNNKIISLIFTPFLFYIIVIRIREIANYFKERELAIFYIIALTSFLVSDLTERK